MYIKPTFDKQTRFFLESTFDIDFLLFDIEFYNVTF